MTVSVGGLTAPVPGALADATTLRTGLVPPLLPPVVARLLPRGPREPGGAGVVAAGRERVRR
ncbi:hypothetical protein ACH4U3_33515 [Streptomyces griseoruber]|uniref:hypothetical protein n=1 Tax=Streptomyces griseoruber TaxID=1943 RepID=UPI003799B025